MKTLINSELFRIAGGKTRYICSLEEIKNIDYAPTGWQIETLPALIEYEGADGNRYLLREGCWDSKTLYEKGRFYFCEQTGICNPY